VSWRRNASVVVALGVASLAAMVATSELLVESFAQPVAEQPDPPAPDLGVPGVIQVEPRAGGARSLPPAAPVTASPNPSRATAPPARPSAPRARAARAPAAFPARACVAATNPEALDRLRPWVDRQLAGNILGIDSTRHQLVPSLSGAVYFGVGLGLMRAGMETWSRRIAERNRD
jgi:hypothetical protein